MFRIYLLIAFSLAFISYSNATCPTDTFPGVNNTWCYKIYETPMTFENATATCLNLNNSGNLACIHNAFENSLIRGLISGNQEYWLGGYAYGDEVDGFVWKWVDGSTFTYSNFKVYISPFLSDILAINVTTGYWDAIYRVDFGLDYALPFICQLKPTKGNKF